VNASTGDFAWEVTLGITESLPEGKQHTGTTNLAGPMATAGGLVFIGATSDGRFRAFDSKTGKELWTYRLDYNATAVPVSFGGKSGKQYVAVVAAGGNQGNGQSLIAFSLP
jgi:quinoprotein glucose dehydrogenase